MSIRIVAGPDVTGIATTLIIAQSESQAERSAKLNYLIPCEWVWVAPGLAAEYIARCADLGVTFTRTLTAPGRSTVAAMTGEVS